MCLLVHLQVWILLDNSRHHWVSRKLLSDFCNGSAVEKSAVAWKLLLFFSPFSAVSHNTAWEWISENSDQESLNDCAMCLPANSKIILNYRSVNFPKIDCSEGIFLSLLSPEPPRMKIQVLLLKATTERCAWMKGLDAWT